MKGLTKDNEHVKLYLMADLRKTRGKNAHSNSSPATGNVMVRLDLEDNERREEEQSICYEKKSLIYITIVIVWLVCH